MLLSSFHCSAHHRAPHSFPTRRSSDLALKNGAHFIATNPDFVCPTPDGGLVEAGDRKSTRLNSSHVAISYAVCCLKKRKADRDRHDATRAYRRHRRRPARTERTRLGTT